MSARDSSSSPDLKSCAQDENCLASLDDYNFFDSVHTGDLLFTTTQLISSTIIRFGTNSCWSHVGIAIWLENGRLVPNSGPNRILHIFDVDKGYEMDVVTLGAVRSCRVSPFRYSIPNCIRIGHRPIKKHNVKAFYRKLHEFILYVCDGQRQINKFKSISPWVGMRTYNDQLIEAGSFRLPKMLHCSELVVIYLRDVVAPSQNIKYNLLKDQSLYSPGDFCANPNHLFTCDTITIYSQPSQPMAIYACAGVFLAIVIGIILLAYLICVPLITYNIII